MFIQREKIRNFSANFFIKLINQVYNTISKISFSYFFCKS
nr:MAG TPA: hypothetical protein [Caudoviricetes sp.]